MGTFQFLNCTRTGLSSRMDYIRTGSSSRSWDSWWAWFWYAFRRVLSSLPISALREREKDRERERSEIWKMLCLYILAFMSFNLSSVWCYMSVICTCEDDVSLRHSQKLKRDEATGWRHLDLKDKILHYQNVYQEKRYTKLIGKTIYVQKNHTCKFLLWLKSM